MNYHDIQIGKEIGFHEFQVTAEMQQNYLYALDDKNSLYRENNYSNTAIAHPVLIVTNAIASEWMSLFEEHVEAKNQIQFIRPAFVGKRISAVSKVYEKYTKRGRYYVTVGFRCIDEDGTEIMDCKSTQVIGHIADMIELQENTNNKNTETYNKYEILSLPRKITIDKMQKFSGHIDGGNNFHTSEKVAIQAGFPTVIAQGMMSYSYILEMLLKELGNKWFSGGNLEVKFLRYVYPGDIITAFGCFQQKNGGNIEINVWCKNQKDEITASGIACFRQ